MAADEGAFVLCLDLLRWSGLCFTKLRRTPRGDLVAKDSAAHLVVNLAIAGSFLFAFYHVDPYAYEQAQKAYKSSAIVYPVYTKLMSLTVVAFSLCGNIYNRRFVHLINIFRRAARDLGHEFYVPGRQRNGRGRKVLFGFLAYAVVLTAAGFWVDGRLTVQYDRMFRIIHYVCFYYVTLFTAHFVLTMNCARENFFRVNAAFERIVWGKRRPLRVLAVISGGQPSIRRKIRVWMAVFMDLRDVEKQVNEIFGRQIFFMLVLAFSSFCVNAYYFITLNLYGTSSTWLNLTMWLGFMQSVMAALVITAAAESTINEANRVNEVLFHFPFHLNNQQMHNLIKYFSLFTYYHPMKFKAWVFYAINYDSFLKVILTSSAVTAVILQLTIS